MGLLEIYTNTYILTLRCHVSIISMKKTTKKAIGMLEHLSQYLPLMTFDQIYKIFICFYFNYCDAIYLTPNLTNPFESSITLTMLMGRVEKIQYQSTLAIVGTWQGASRNKLYDELGLESLSDR